MFRDRTVRNLPRRCSRFPQLNKQLDAFHAWHAILQRRAKKPRNSSRHSRFCRTTSSDSTSAPRCPKRNESNPRPLSPRLKTALPGIDNARAGTPAGWAALRFRGGPWSVESWARMSLLAEKCEGLILFARNAEPFIDQRRHNIV